MSSPSQPPPYQNWKLTLAYDGTDFHGWQIQPTLPTIQQTLARALHLLTGEAVLPQASGRTDTGVHALAQVVSFPLATAIPPSNLLRALNNALPTSIRILTAEHAPAGFHARHSARSKTYEYRIALTEPSPFNARYQWHCTYPLNLRLMNQAAHQILGTHDFTSFAASDPDLATRLATSQAPAKSVISTGAKRSGETSVFGTSSLTPNACHSERSEESPYFANATDTPSGPPPTTTRTITASLWTQHENELRYTITGTGFLHHMVRNLVGTFVDVGRAHTTPEQFAKILAAKNRTAAGPTAPPQGLFLISVDY